MSHNKSYLAFDDVREIFDRALIAPKGVHVSLPTRGKAVATRSRFNYFRLLDREENGKTYEKDHPMYNRSAYDKLVLRIPPKGAPDENILYIEPHSALNYIVKENE
jgi:hypothetical protein